MQQESGRSARPQSCNNVMKYQRFREGAYFVQVSHKPLISTVTFLAENA
jgi:hypothetical protein